jgi:hypothetical protein
MENNELNRQMNYIIAVHNATDKYAFINSVEEAELYIERYPSRKVVIFSETYRNDQLRKIAYNQVQTFKKGEIRIADKKDNDNFNEVVETMNVFLKNGLLIVHGFNLNGQTIGQVLNRSDKAQDFIVHRNEIKLYPEEITYINNQIVKANELLAQKQPYRPIKNVFLRIHRLDSFKFNKEYLISLAEKFGQEIGFGIFLSQFILLRNSNNFRKDLETECERAGEKFEDYIDPYWFAKLSSNYVYFNLVTQQISGASPEFLEQVKSEIIEYFKRDAG